MTAYRRFMGRVVLRIVLGAGVALALVVLWASIAFRWPAQVWIVTIGFIVLLIGVGAGLVTRRRSRAASAELSASDPYSDIQLGRTANTHPPRDEKGTSQIGDPPDGPDPLIR